MTSAKVMLTRMGTAPLRRQRGQRCLPVPVPSLLALSLLLSVSLLALPGCGTWGHDDSSLTAPYGERQVWAVAPLANESGTLQVDGARVADHLTQQLERAKGLDVVAVNRVLAAMESLGMAEVTSPDQAMKLRRTLGVDALLVGTVTAYDPYDPPKLGLAVELYTGPRRPCASLEIRELTHAATDTSAQPPAVDPLKPVSVVSGFYDAADPNVRQLMEQYAKERGSEAHAEENWRLYRISMDLYTEFVAYVVSDRLLAAERQRLQPVPATETATSP